MNRTATAVRPTNIFSDSPELAKDRLQLVKPMSSPAQVLQIDDALQDESEMALSILKSHNFKAKVFCYAVEDDQREAFRVKTDGSGWIVEPLVQDQIQDIPLVYRRGLALLLKHNLNIEGIALAKPDQTKNFSSIVATELAATIVPILKGLAIVVYILISMIRKSLESQPSTTRQSSKPDPVLLVKLDNKWIEIGRWF